MIDAGILPGDTVIVKKSAPTKVGDIIVAMVDNEFTVKYLAQNNNEYFLRPGNKEYSDIRPLDYLKIYGLVVGVFRKN